MRLRALLQLGAGEGALVVLLLHLLEEVLTGIDDFLGIRRREPS